MRDIDIDNSFVGNINDRQCIIELDKDEHPFYIGCQYHPEYQTYPFKPHPLFVGLLESGLAHNPTELIKKIYNE